MAMVEPAATPRSAPGAPRTTRPAAIKKITRRSRKPAPDTRRRTIRPPRPHHADGGRKQRSRAMRIRPKLAAGAAAAVLALTASAGAASSPGETDAVPAAARHAPADNRFTELLALSQVKRAV